MYLRVPLRTIANSPTRGEEGGVAGRMLRWEGGGEAGEKGVAPGNLPLPLMYDPLSLLLYTSGQTRVAYGCQRDGLLWGGGGTESSKKEDDGTEIWGAGGTADASNKNNNALRYPPPVPPSLNLQTATAEERAFKNDSWTLLQLPTRLPRLEKISSISGSVKAQQNPDGVGPLDVNGGGGGGGGTGNLLVVGG